ncbi:putative sugar nucleotidyl transferase [Sphingobacterium endophyticum]|uniref:putative sugar nucleotidyl transferase n=1 Tax=Sphingobacterium endophyticum TaxID=2546448 RepID=UPI0012E0CD5F|nr:putative sugar nucleotidyl transferase [Sphingobacterium endophyticum]
MSLTIVLSDNAHWRKRLFPLAATRPVGNIRIGICTINEKWKHIFQCPVTYDTADYLREKFTDESNFEHSEYLIIRANVLPSLELISELKSLSLGEVLLDNHSWIAIKSDTLEVDLDQIHLNFHTVRTSCEISYLNFLEDIFIQNKSQLIFDFNLLTRGRQSSTISSSNQVYGSWIFIEEGAMVEGASLNSLEGPIYIGKDAKVEEGSYIKGYVSIGSNARVKTGARIYPNTTIGPGSTICGEINNTVIWGNSAKGHEGYLGCSVLGEGCNIGAGSSNSNLKNNWKVVRLFDYEDLSYRETDVLKCGLFMGDYAMCGINSSFTTGSVIGVGSQVAISKFIPKFVPDFSWMTDDENATYTFEKFIEMMERRAEGSGLEMLEKNISIFKHIFEDVKYLHGKNQS